MYIYTFNIYISNIYIFICVYILNYVPSLAARHLLMYFAYKPLNYYRCIQNLIYTC